MGNPPGRFRATIIVFPPHFANSSCWSARATKAAALCNQSMARCCPPELVRVRLLFRRAFIELIDQKSWDAPDILMEEEILTLSPEP
jgi:hypothetical protein